eukprot:g78568.t1
MTRDRPSQRHQSHNPKASVTQSQKFSSSSNRLEKLSVPLKKSFLQAETGLQTVKFPLSRKAKAFAWFGHISTSDSDLSPNLSSFTDSTSRRAQSGLSQQAQISLEFQLPSPFL